MKQTDQLIRTIEMEESIIGLRKDGIMHLHYKPYAEITVEQQGRQLMAMKELCGGKKRPMIYQAAEYVTVGREARENAIAREEETPILCNVVYVQSLAHKMIADFYYRFNKPRQPYKVVSEFAEGIRWLLQISREIDEREQGK